MTIRYDLPDGSVLISPYDLNYALDENCNVLLHEVPSNILSECTIANYEPNNLSQYYRQEDPTGYLHQRDYCKMVGGVPHIRNGKEYQALPKVLSSASASAKRYIRAQLDLQTHFYKSQSLPCPWEAFL